MLTVGIKKNNIHNNKAGNKKGHGFIVLDEPPIFLPVYNYCSHWSAVDTGHF
tara:strand:- start:20 stop:175 length:156 start_codon:yes stop_codon:yes gene_type:complete